MTRYFLLYLCLLGLSLFDVVAQTSFCPDDVPINRFLADSPWPIYHRNNYAQSSTCLPGPTPGDSLVIKARTRIRGGTSPWIYLTDTYPRGERALLYSNSTHVYKFIDNGKRIIQASKIQIDRDAFRSFGWNFLLAKNKTWFTYDPKYDPKKNEYTRLFKIRDTNPSNPYSALRIADTLNFGDYGVNRVQHYSLNYRGQIVFNSDNDEENNYGTVGIITQNFKVLDILRYPTTKGEITSHNAFPVDENNSFYITTNKRLIKFDWNGRKLSIAWEAPYDFVADGPTGTFAEGSGTTPTLVGWGEGNDKLVVMADGHAQNNLVAFWRELPEGWTGKPGMDIHFADSIKLPAAVSFSNLFQSIEDSPTAYGYDLAIAQFNGFLGYDCENYKGVQKITWETEENKFKVAWVNRDINMNGILTYSKATNMVYSSGKESDCNYYYYGLDWDTGELVLRKLLGPEGTFRNDPFYDGGNNSIIDEKGNIYFAGGSSIVKVENLGKVPSAAKPPSTLHDSLAFDKGQLRLRPNPTRQYVRIAEDGVTPEDVLVFDVNGQQMSNWSLKGKTLDLGALPTGVYLLRIETESKVLTGKVVKQ